MSLEAAIQENTVAINKLAALLSGAKIAPAGDPQIKAETSPVKTADKPATTKAEKPKPEPVLEPEPETEKPVDEQKPTKPATKEDALKAGTALLKAKGSVKFQETLGVCQAGAKTLGALSVENYGKFIELCQEALVS